MVHCDLILAEISESKKLWKNIEPHLKKALHTLYLREVSSSQWERYQQELENSEDVALHGRSFVHTFLHQVKHQSFLNCAPSTFLEMAEITYFHKSQHLNVIALPFVIGNDFSTCKSTGAYLYNKQIFFKPLIFFTGEMPPNDAEVIMTNSADSE